MTLTDALVAVAIMIGLVGILLPVLPGTLLVWAAILVWALEVSRGAGWVVFAVGTAFLAAGAVVKYVVPGRRLHTRGVPTSTLVAGGLLGAIGFFVVPVVGLVLGFVLGIYLAELARVGSHEAWPATKHALKAVGLSIAIELTAALLATATWVVGVAAT